MSAETRWKVRVLVTVERTIDVSAVTMADAVQAASDEPGIIAVLDVAWNNPEEGDEADERV